MGFVWMANNEKKWVSDLHTFKLTLAAISFPDFYSFTLMKEQTAENVKDWLYLLWYSEAIATKERSINTEKSNYCKCEFQEKRIKVI